MEVHTDHHRCLSTKLEDTRLEILGCLAGEDPPDTVTSSELVKQTCRKISKKRFNLRTAIFRTAGWAIISEVSEGVLSADIGKKLITPAGSPA